VVGHAKIIKRVINDNKNNERRTMSNDNLIQMVDSIVEWTADRLAYKIHDTKIRREVSIMLHGSLLEDDDIPQQLVPDSQWKKIRAKAVTLNALRRAATGQEARNDSTAYWTNLAADEDAPWAVRARARENLDKVQGVAAPEVSVVLQANAEEVLTLKDLGLDLAEKKAALASIRERRAASEEAAMAS
jgi:hypothetical protein